MSGIAMTRKKLMSTSFSGLDYSKINTTLPHSPFCLYLWQPQPIMCVGSPQLPTIFMEFQLSSQEMAAEDLYGAAVYCVNKQKQQTTNNKQQTTSNKQLASFEPKPSQVSLCPALEGTTKWISSCCQSEYPFWCHYSCFKILSPDVNQSINV